MSLRLRQAILPRIRRPDTTVPTGLVVTSANSTTTADWADVAGATAYRVYSRNDGTETINFLAEVTSSTRTSGTLTVGAVIHYSVSSVVSGVESARSAEVPVTVVSGSTGGGGGDSSTWRAAKDSYSESAMLTWMLANTGHRIDVSVTAPGGTITTQAQCDAMKGRTVTADVTFSPAAGVTIIPEDTLFKGGRVNYSTTGGTTLMRWCTIDGNDQTYSPDHHRIRGNVTFENVRVRKAQDGFKIGDANYAGTVVMRNVLIFEPSQLLGALTGNQTHQDAIQVMGGSVDCERVFINYENNHSGGQGMIIKADARTITKFRFVDSFLKAGGNNMTFEPKTSTDTSPGALDLGSGIYRNVVAPATDMINVLSLYEPVGAMDEPARGTLLSSSFFVAEKNGATLVYKNGITKTTLNAVASL